MHLVQQGLSQNFAEVPAGARKAHIGCQTVGTAAAAETLYERSVNGNLPLEDRVMLWPAEPVPSGSIGGHVSFWLVGI